MMRSLACGMLAAILLAAAAWGARSSGPGRVTLEAFPWGTVYYRSTVEDRYRIELETTGSVLFHSRRGDIVVSYGRDAVAVDYWDKSSLFIRPEDGELHVQAGKRSAWIRQGVGSFTVRLPDDEVRYRRRGRGVAIEGRAGTVRVEEDARGFRVESPAGITTYERPAEGGAFSLQGKRLWEHPYVRKGIFFEHMGVGLFVDFHLEDMSRAFTLLPWEPAWIVNAD